MSRDTLGQALEFVAGLSRVEIARVRRRFGPMAAEGLVAHGYATLEHDGETLQLTEAGVRAANDRA